MLGLCIGLSWAAVGAAAPGAEPKHDTAGMPAQTVPAGTGTDAKSPTTEAVCAAIASAVARTGLPLAFFTRLIWQESRFDPVAVSRKGARGVAQFMPGTASWRGLRDPFDPLAAIPKAAELLAELRRQFGNLGLAAAAYIRARPGAGLDGWSSAAA
jgi:soluble lytic murein transglycosylase-like protein